MNILKVFDQRLFLFVPMLSFLFCTTFAQPLSWIGESEDIIILCNGVVGYNEFLLQSADIASEFYINSEVLSQLGDFKHRLLEENIELLLVVLPPRGITTNLNTTNYSHTKARENFDAFIRDIQVSGIDILNLLDGINEEDRQKFFRFRDPHWSSTGLEIAAAKVADYIESKQISFELKEIESSFVSIDLVPYYLELTSEGCPDLTKNYLDNNGLGSVIETLHLKNAVVSSNGNLQDSLFGDDASPIVVAGTSQSNSPYKFASWLSSEIAMSVTDYSVSGGSAYSGLELLLSDLQQGKVAKPKLIIWEMPVSEMTKMTTDDQGPAFDNQQSMSQISPWLSTCNDIIDIFQGRSRVVLEEQRQPLSNFVQEINPKGVTISEELNSGNTIMTFTGELDPWLSYVVPKSRLPKESKLNFEVILLPESSVTHAELFIHTNSYSDILAQTGLFPFVSSEKELQLNFEVPNEIRDSLIVFRIDGPDVPIEGTTMEVSELFIRGISSLEKELIFSDLEHHNIYGNTFFVEIETFDEVDNKFVVEFNYGNGITHSVPVFRSSRVSNNNIYRVAFSPFISRPLESIDVLFNQDVNSLGVKNAKICEE